MAEERKPVLVGRGVWVMLCEGWGGMGWKVGKMGKQVVLCVCVVVWWVLACVCVCASARRRAAPDIF